MRTKSLVPIAVLATAWLAAAAHAQPAARDHLLLVISQTDNTLTAYTVGATSLTPAAIIPVGHGAREVCVAADGRRAYVSNDKDNTVTVVDLGTLKVTATIALAGLLRPDGCATSPDSKKVYVTALDSEAVGVDRSSNQPHRRDDQGGQGAAPRHLHAGPSPDLRVERGVRRDHDHRSRHRQGG